MCRFAGVKNDTLYIKNHQLLIIFPLNDEPGVKIDQIYTGLVKHI